LSLTDEGSLFYNRCRDLLASLEEAESELGQRTGTASGLLRINVPVTYGITHLSALWGEFLTRHPQVRLDVTLADRVVDLVEEGYDLAIRIARLPNSTLISRKLTSTRIVLCASPTYLKTHGTPQHPNELAQHPVIGYSYKAGGDDWSFDGPEGQVTVKTNPCIHSNNGDTCRAVALAHQGIVLQPEFLIGEDLVAGRLVELMPEYRSIELGIYAVYPSRKYVAPKVRALMEFLGEKLA
jgi:DNA-binding transcriptional LysR family regulator